MNATLSDLVAGWFNNVDSRMTDEDIERSMEAFQLSEVYDNGLPEPRWIDMQVRAEMMEQNDFQFPE